MWSQAARIAGTWTKTLRRGAKIRARAIYRDPVLQPVSLVGQRFACSLMWLGHVPWAGRHWACRCSAAQQQGRQHKKLTNCAAGCPTDPWCTPLDLLHCASPP